MWCNIQVDHQNLRLRYKDPHSPDVGPWVYYPENATRVEILNAELQAVREVYGRLNSSTWEDFVEYSSQQDKKIRDLGERFIRWNYRREAWVRDKLKIKPGVDPAGTMEHIRKELKELAEAKGSIEEFGEIVDLVFLVFQLATIYSLSFPALVQMLEEKLEVNKERVWNVVDPSKPIEHERSIPQSDSSKPGG